METTNRAIPLTYEKAILYMVGPLCFVGGATLFWLTVHCVMRSLFSDKWKRENETHLARSQKNDSNFHMPIVSRNQAPNKRTSLNMMSSLRSKVDNYKGEEWTYKDTQRYLIVSCLVAMVILHPTLTRQSLFLFMCVNIEDGTYLRKDVQLECYNSEHFSYLFAVGVPGIVGYVVGIPAVTFWVLYRRQFKLNIEGPAGDATRKTYGFIYQGYGIYYWEVIIMLRKVSMVIVAVFGLRATVQTQALMALLVVLLAAAAHVQLKPFDVRILDKLELYGLLTAFTTLYFGMFFFTRDVENSPFFLAVVTTIILSANFIFVIYWSCALYGALRTEIKFIYRCDARVRLRYNYWCRKYCKWCTCNLASACRKCCRNLRRYGRNWRRRGRDENDSDSDEDDDHNSIEMTRRTDHTVRSRMSD
jgi:hypothetical protein